MKSNQLKSNKTIEQLKIVTNKSRKDILFVLYRDVLYLFLLFNIISIILIVLDKIEIYGYIIANILFILLFFLNISPIWKIKFNTLNKELTITTCNILTGLKKDKTFKLYNIEILSKGSRSGVIHPIAIYSAKGKKIILSENKYNRSFNKDEVLKFITQIKQFL